MTKLITIALKSKNPHGLLMFWWIENIIDTKYLIYAMKKSRIKNKNLP